MATDPSTDEKKLIKLKSGVSIDIKATVIEGVMRRVKHVGDNGWAIVEIAGINCIGNFHERYIGGMYTVEGAFQENKKYSTWDFKAKSYKVVVETTVGIRDLLITECKWLGPALANRLVGQFRKDTLKVIEMEPEKVAEFLKIDIVKAKEIQQWAVGQSANLDMKQKLYKIGITAGKVARIISEYGSDAERKIKADCFSLTKIHGFGFKTVDQIAELIGVPQTDPGRIKAAIKYALESMYEQGHTCLAVSEVIREVCSLTGLTQEVIKPHMKAMIESKEILTSKEDWEKYKETHSKESLTL